MPSKEEKQRRRKIKLALKVKERQQFTANLPLKKELLLELFDYLDTNNAIENCNHNFKIATAFLDKKGIKNDKIYNWFEEFGGYCDCEILYNVAENFDDLP